MAVIRGQECYCGYPTGRFPLHDSADGLRCSGTRNASSAAEGKYCLVYQTPVQGTSSSLAVPGPPLLENSPCAPSAVGKSNLVYNSLSHSTGYHRTGRNVGNSLSLNSPPCNHVHEDASFHPLIVQHRLPPTQNPIIILQMERIEGEPGKAFLHHVAPTLGSH